MKKIKSKNEKPVGSTKVAVVRTDLETKKLIDDELLKLKKIKVGSKKITISNLLNLALSRITDEDRKQLLSSSVTGEDRIRVAFHNYSKENKKVDKGTFLDMASYGEIKMNDFLPEVLEDLKAFTVLKSRRW